MDELENYDQNGFNKHGIHRETGTNYDSEGYSKKGYDKEGYNREGYDKKGYNREGYNRQGYDRYGFKRDGYNGRNFNMQGVNRVTGTSFDEHGYDIEGYDQDGFNAKGYDRFGYDKTGFSRNGYDREGYNRDGFGADGYDREGYDRDGYSKEGRDRDGYGRNHRDRDGFDKFGYNKNGYNRAGFNRAGYNRYGYDREGYNKEGYNNLGFNRDGYDRQGMNQEGYDQEGYDKQGFDKTGYDRDGYDRDGYNIDGYNRRKFDRNKVHKDTGTSYDEEGFDNEGFNKEGYNREGLDRLGLDRFGINKSTGEIDDRVLLGKEFIDLQMTIPQFAKFKGKTVEEVTSIIDTAKNIACIRDDIISTLSKNSNRYIGAKLSEKDKLLEGKIGIREVRGIEKTLALCTKEERERVMQLFVSSISSHSITILEYKDIFAIENISSKLPQTIIDKLSAIKSEMTRSKEPETRKQVKEMYAEVRRLESYRTPYKSGDLTKIGYSENGKSIMFDITPECEELAKRYLLATDEFICYKTMSSTLTRIAKGDVGIEEVNELELVKKAKDIEIKQSVPGEMEARINHASADNSNEKRRAELLASIKASQQELARLTAELAELNEHSNTTLRYRRNIE